MTRSGIHIEYWWEIQEERDYYGDHDVGGRIILKWILEIKDWVAWNGLIWFRIGTNGWLL
jgi:hypothetical protein